MFRLKSVLASSRITFWPLQVCGWVGYFTLNFLSAIGYGKSWDYVFVSLACASIGFLITCVLRLGYRALWHLPMRRMSWRAACMLVVAAIVFATCYATITFRYCDDCRPDSVLGYIGYFGSMLYVLLSWSGLYFGIKFNRQLQQQKLAALQALAMAHEAQLKMLRYQLNPHFLFNTLNAISTLILDAKQDTANRMVSSLSAFLRYSLDSDPVQRVSLAQEIEALNLYLGIEQLRFGERLQVIMDIAPEARNALVPSLILQPLIENAVKYAIAKREQGGSVELLARRDGDDLDLRLRDDGPGSDDFPDKQLPCRGVGLANTRERLRVLYGERQSFSIANRQPHGVEVHLRLPFEAAPAGN
ncbi:sensor histidine kinase [Pseudolysobacter antarcticus]|uniref:Sensor histidine kinase n=1 Tax=Pseudolysobacter antarcticus TaxID=2511995 RepID=A0A411HKU2_9GAMM|nr:sensor histidine kinase [Pseudolysobacter antarcticus]